MRKDIGSYFINETERLLGGRDLKVFKEAERLIRIGGRKELEEARRLTGYDEVFDIRRKRYG